MFDPYGIGAYLGYVVPRGRAVPPGYADAGALRCGRGYSYLISTGSGAIVRVFVCKYSHTCITD